VTKGRKKSKKAVKKGPDAPVEDQVTDDDDDDMLHGVCGESLVGADTNPNDCLLGKFVAKVFLPAKGDDDKLFTGTVTHYDQKTKKFTVVYHADKYKEKHSAVDVQKLRKQFEKWYGRVSANGQRFTRKQALPIICGAYDKETLQLKAKLGAPIDLTKLPEPGKATKEDQLRLALSIKAMKVVRLREVLTEKTLKCNDTPGNKQTFT
jgi:hypothetical protein